MTPRSAGTFVLPGRRLLALLAVLVGLFAATLLWAAPASAHATVTASDPADGSRLTSAPTAVSISFDEPVGLGGVGYLNVTDQTGKRVDGGAAGYAGSNQATIRVPLAEGLGDGTYTASFRVVSADSHPIAGTIRFVVGDGALVRGSVSESSGNLGSATLLDVLRWVSFTGFALLGGVWVVLTLWPQGRTDPRSRRLLWGGWGITAFGAVTEVLMQGPYSAGSSPAHAFDPSLIDSTLHSHFGQWHIVRLVLLAVLGLVFARSLRPDASRNRWEGVVALLGIGLAASFSSIGHPGTTAPTGLSIPVDLAHLLAMSVWVGGLIMLVGAVLPRREPSELSAVVPVFSTVAFVAIVVLAVTGTYSAWRGIGTVDAILTTTYGLLVIGKVVLFIALLALANLSRKTVRRALSHPVATERLRRSVYVESLAALVVLALTAVLVAEPRGNEALAAQYRQPISASATLGAGRMLTVTSDPGTHGEVNLTVDVSAGPTPTSITAGATQIDKEIGPVPVTLTRAGGRTFSGSAPLTVAGRWRISVVVTTSEFDAVTADVTLDLH
ncbi:MAG: copper resistance protein CopC [Jatrophihabitans sp.]